MFTSSRQGPAVHSISLHWQKWARQTNPGPAPNFCCSYTYFTYFTWKTDHVGEKDGDCDWINGLGLATSLTTRAWTVPSHSQAPLSLAIERTARMYDRIDMAHHQAGHLTLAMPQENEGLKAVTPHNKIPYSRHQPYPRRSCYWIVLLMSRILFSCNGE